MDDRLAFCARMQFTVYHAKEQSACLLRQAGNTRYIMRGGIAGRERLRILSRVMQPTSRSLLERVDLGPGMSFLDAVAEVQT
jgi:hypothetical protein